MSRSVSFRAASAKGPAIDLERIVNSQLPAREITIGSVLLFKEKRFREIVAALRRNGVDVDVKRLRKACLSHPRVLEIRGDRIAAHVGASSKALGWTKEAFVKIACERASLLYARAAALHARMTKLGRYLKVERHVVLEMARRAPILLGLDVRNVETKIKAWAAVLGLDVRAACGMAVLSPRLLELSAERIRQWPQTLSRELGVSRREARAMLWRRPALARCNESHFGKTLDAFAHAFALEKADARRLVCRYPGLLTMKTATLRRNVAALALALAIPRAAAVELALRFAPLFWLGPARVAAWIDEIAAIGVPRAAIVNAVRHSPTLLGRRAAGIRQRIGSLIAFAKAMGDRVDARSIFESYAWCLTYSQARIDARMKLAGKLGQRFSWSSLMAMTDARVSTALGGETPILSKKGQARPSSFR